MSWTLAHNESSAVSYVLLVVVREVGVGVGGVGEGEGAAAAEVDAVV